MKVPLKKRKENLANCRSGRIRRLGAKLVDPSWKPDFVSPQEFNDSVSKSGATAISARDFLVAYNINLNTTSTRRANAVLDIREAGRLKRRRFFSRKNIKR